jgi:putative NIF3 family GTP cyclohydrolase 1 type 2
MVVSPAEDEVRTELADEGLRRPIDVIAGHGAADDARPMSQDIVAPERLGGEIGELDDLDRSGVGAGLQRRQPACGRAFGLLECARCWVQHDVCPAAIMLQAEA